MFKIVPLPPDGYERCLTDENEFIREATAYKRAYKPSKEQLFRGIQDPSKWVRKAWASRDDLDVPEWMVSIGLKDKDPEVASIWEKRFLETE